MEQAIYGSFDHDICTGSLADFDFQFQLAKLLPLRFANPAVFPHHYWFVWGRGTLPLRQF